MLPSGETGQKCTRDLCVFTTNACESITISIKFSFFKKMDQSLSLKDSSSGWQLPGAGIVGALLH